MSSSCVQMSLASTASQRLRHEFQRMVDQPLVVVAPGIGDARNAQPVLIDFVGERDAIGFLRQHFADDLQPDHMIVFFHLVASGAAPQSPRALIWVLAHSCGNGPWLM